MCEQQLNLSESVLSEGEVPPFCLEGVPIPGASPCGLCQGILALKEIW